MTDRSAICILDIIVYRQRAQERLIAQTHSVLAYLGTTKMLSCLKEYIWWRDMVDNVGKYCATCQTCARSKPLNQKLYRLLSPLNVPIRPWDAIEMDFVGPFPVSKNRDGEYDSITVVIDLLTTMVHLVPS